MGSDCAPFDTQMHRVLALSFLGVLKGIAEWGGFMGPMNFLMEGLLE